MDRGGSTRPRRGRRSCSKRACGTRLCDTNGSHTFAIHECTCRETKAEKGIIGEGDLYTLAIDCRRIPHAPFGNTLPYFIQAFLPFGPLTLTMDRKTGELGNPFYAYRETISKASGSKVRTDNFLNPTFSFVSAVLHSSVDCV